MAVQDVIEAIREHIGGFTPASRSQIDEFYTSLPELHRELGKALGEAADRCADERGINPDVVESLRDQGAAATGIADSAEQTEAEHISAHGVWLED